MKYCTVCFKQKPSWRMHLKTCSKKCVNAWSWMTKKERKEAIEKSIKLENE